MSMVKMQHEFLQDVVKLLQKAYELGFVVTGGELWRPIEMQKLYVKMGRSKTMQSAHLNRLAIDFNFFLDGKLVGRKEIEPLGKFWESLHPKNRWGGSWRGLIEAGKSSFVDAPHFERQV